MQSAAKLHLVSALVTLVTALGCGGTSGERPVPPGSNRGGGGGNHGSGGAAGSGGGGGAGGTSVAITAGKLDCSRPIVPANRGDNGFVTDFSDYGSGTFGDAGNVYGSTFYYAEVGKSTMTSSVDSAMPALTGSGTVVQNSYGGIGISFYVCTTVADFSRLEFTLQGSWPGCDLELQVKTWTQTPKDQSPAGNCDGSCYNYPVKKQLSTGSDTPTTISITLADLSDWSAENASQVIGLQWQFTGTMLDPDAGSGCPIDARISNVRFIP